MTSEYEEIICRFERIRDAARHDEPLPGDLIYRCDVNCYEDLKRLFVGHKILKNISKEELFEKGSEYKNAYITEYRGTVLQYKIYVEDHKRRMRASQAQARLIKDYAKMSQKEIFVAFFCELIPLLSDDVTGRKLREGPALKLWTGVSGLSEDEAKEIMRANAFEEVDESA